MILGIRHKQKHSYTYVHTIVGEYSSKIFAKIITTFMTYSENSAAIILAGSIALTITLKQMSQSYENDQK